MTKAVLFDLGDTLFGLGPMPDVTSGYTAFLRAEGVVEPELGAARILGTLRERMMAGYGRGQLEEPSIAELVLPFIGTGEQAERHARELDRLLGNADTSRWDPGSGRDQTLDAIRDRGVKIGFVSNTLTAPELMRARLAEFGLLSYAEVAVFSVEHRVRKPNPAIYRVAIEAMNVAAEDVVFVGDRVREDVRGPQSLGMRSILTHEFRQEDPADSNPLGVVRHLRQVLDLLA